MQPDAPASAKDIKRAQNIAWMASQDVERKTARHRRTAENYGCPTLEALRLAVECGELEEMAVAEALADPSNLVWSWQDESGWPMKAPLLWDAIKHPAAGDDLKKWAINLAMRSARFDPWAPWGPRSESGIAGGRSLEFALGEAFANARAHGDRPDEADAAAEAGRKPTTLLEELIREGGLEWAATWAKQTHRGQTDTSWADAVLVCMSGQSPSTREANRPYWSELLALAKAIESRKEIAQEVFRRPAEERQPAVEDAFSPIRAANAGKETKAAGANPRENWANLGSFEGVRGGILDKWWARAKDETSRSFGSHQETQELFCDLAMQQLMEVKERGQADAEEAFRWIMSESSASAPDGNERHRRPLAAWLLLGAAWRSERLASEFWAWMQTARSFSPAARAEREEECLMNWALIGSFGSIAMSWARSMPPDQVPANWAPLAVMAWANSADEKRELLPAFLAICERAQIDGVARAGQEAVSAASTDGQPEEGDGPAANSDSQPEAEAAGRNKEKEHPRRL